MWSLHLIFRGCPSTRIHKGEKLLKSSDTPKPKHVTIRPTRVRVQLSFRTSEDGTPSVTFPKNFDRIVGLMGRSELQDQSPDEEAKDSTKSGGLKRSPEGRREDGAKRQAKGAAQGDRLPPWTKYLLEEGLDRTKAFSRYKGMFAGETIVRIHMLLREAV